MPYEVIARKWRPQRFEDVVGQEHVTRTLANAVKTGRLAHAYLFVGPRGIGKTSIARIFAKALNCAGGPTVTPCGTCDSCREVMAGTSLDVLEIDGASNTGVDHIRDLRESVMFAAARDHFKIYIIDEVHMLSQGAFNALLKTLEEPPPHVKFFFATTEPDKVLPTIVSRCQRFDLRRIPVSLIMERLRLIADSEKVAVDDDALLAVARGAEGGLRDAESALDQLISFRGSKITEEDVLSVFGLVRREVLESLAGHILAGDVRAIISVIGELDKAGKDLTRVIVELMEYFRNLLVLVSVGGDAGVLDLAAGQVDAVRAHAAMTNAGRVLRVITILTETADRMRYALSRRILLETALIRCARSATVVSLEEILQKIEALQRQGGGEAAAVAAPAPAVRTPVAAAPPPAVAAAPAAEPADDAGELERLAGRWRDVVTRAATIAVSVKPLLTDSRPLAVRGSKVVVGYDPEFKDEVANLESGRGRKAIERVLADVLKRAVTVEFVPDSTFGAGAPVEAAPVTKPAVSDGARKTKKGLMGDPAVQKALDAFEGTVVEVRE